MTPSDSVQHDEDATADENGTVVIKSYRQELQESGNSSGVALHFEADIAEALKMDPNTEVEVSVVDEEGDIKVILNNIPAGFTRETFEEFAAKHDWTQTSSLDVGDNWSLTYRDSTREVRIEVDSTTQVDGEVVNNIFIEGPEVLLEEDLEAYRDLCMIANQKDLRVRVRDSDGLWQRLKASTDHNTDDAPDEQTFQQLINATDRVTVQLTTELATLTTSLDEIERAVTAIQETVEESVA
jgi:anti-sigma regulatory factor (Ser/Thr protein kinase)